jgi:2-polyprenyl-6-methoxyphenol hydroxylase-like FAD-dependent oxidoreductase
MKVIIVGAGIGGLTTALFLNKHGIDCEVFEQTPAIQELGVGINLMPHATAAFDEIGVLPALEHCGIAPDYLIYRTSQGLTVWHEPRGRRAGLPYPQITIHRGHSATPSNHEPQAAFMSIAPLCPGTKQTVKSKRTLFPRRANGSTRKAMF